ncbi:MAG TPA: hypothetical protein DCG66_09975 [Brevundimonas sp.]|nr:hypothetical protein [Brevundimonas sp.]
MSKERSPRLDCSTTMGTRFMFISSIGSRMEPSQECGGARDSRSLALLFCISRYEGRLTRWGPHTKKAGIADPRLFTIR